MVTITLPDEGDSQVDVTLPRAVGSAGPAGPAGPAGVGVPAGGTTGQVLAKSSGVDYATSWVTGGGGGSTAWADITGKPTFATVATSGAYADLSGNPTLGTLASQNASSVSITGGSVTGIVDLAVADGGTGASTASVARTNLGLAIGVDVQAYSAALSTVVKNNFTATVAPSPTDDSSAGYAVGSTWMRTDTGTMWRARSVAVGAARWVRIDAADFFGYVAGNFYDPLPGLTVAAGSALALDTIRLHPTIIKERCTISDLGARLTTASASQSVQFAIYANNPANNRPTGTALGMTGNISTTTTGPVQGPLSVSAQLEAGIYWMAANSSSNTPAFSSIANTNTTISSLIGSATLSTIMSGNTAALFTLSVAAQTFGTWPDLTSATITESTATSFPMIVFKVSSIP